MRSKAFIQVPSAPKATFAPFLPLHVMAMDLLPSSLFGFLITAAFHPVLLLLENPVRERWLESSGQIPGSHTPCRSHCSLFCHAVKAFGSKKY